MTNDAFAGVFDGIPASPGRGYRDMDIARSIQAVTEDIVLRLARTLQTRTGEKN